MAQSSVETDAGGSLWSAICSVTRRWNSCSTADCTRRGGLVLLVDQLDLVADGGGKPFDRPDVQTVFEYLTIGLLGDGEPLE